MAWKRLALAGILLLYLINFLFIAFETGTLNGLGNDFLAFWSAGKTADLFGYQYIYDLKILAQVQYQPIRYLNISSGTFQPIPVPYLSFFLIPFQLLSKINAQAGFWIWTALNLSVLVGYLFFFLKGISKAFQLKTFPSIILVSLLLSYPVYANLVYGQVNVMLVICCGEFIRCALAGRPLASGAWLGGMLLKPQMLLLIIPALLLMKHWKMFAGFVLSAMGVLLVSVVLSGLDGVVAMIRLWFVYVPGIATNSPNAMANWRMLATNINTWSSSWVGWIPAGIGMLATLAIWFLLCRRPSAFRTSAWVDTMMAIFAASCAFSWHSHVHMGMVMLPFLVVFAARSLPQMRVVELDAWVFVIPAAMLLGYVISIVIFLLNGPAIENLSNFLTGLAGLAVYMFIAIRGLKKKDLLEHTL
jgi:hypothetical protein